MYVVIQLNFKQNIETLNKISSIIGKKKELPEGKGENKSKIDLSLVLAAPAYVAMVAYQLQDCLMPMPHPRHINVTSHDMEDKINHNLPNLRLWEHGNMVSLKEMHSAQEPTDYSITP